MSKEAVIWSKDGCRFCVLAKDLLELHGYMIEERNISSGDWSKDQLLEAVPGARTVPQIFIDGDLKGGYDDIVRFID